MGLCQPDRNVPFSCGACCGLFNLQTSPDKLRTILEDRTNEFRQTVDFSRPYTMAEFRKQREVKEKDIERKDPLTYNCPFLGKLTESASSNEGEKTTMVYYRIGCMIHPIYTGDPKSQNYSFYGSSICQAYDCRNKERRYSQEWEEVFVDLSEDSFSYSSLASDYRTIDMIEGYLKEEGFSETEWFTIERNRIIGFLKQKFKGKISLWNTSFELEMESPPPISYKERLANWLGISTNHLLFSSGTISDE